MVNLQTLGTTWAPRLLSVLRIMAGLLFLEHGTAKLLDFPAGGWPMGTPEFGTMLWFSAILELVGGALVAVGALTRVVAFLLSGEMAVAYFTAHAPTGFFPILNHGEGAILYCFIFLYVAAAGGGPWSLDAVLCRKQSAAAG